jgi:hypothetical protein
MRVDPRVLPILGLVLAWWMIVGSGKDASDIERDLHHWELEAIVGTWVEEGGEPGNYLRLTQMPTGSPSFFGLLTALDSRATFFRQFGKAEKTKAVWNFENSYPLRLNVVFDTGGRFLAVGFIDRDHARMRLLDDINVAVQPGVLSSAEAKVMTRAK